MYMCVCLNMYMSRDSGGGSVCTCMYLHVYVCTYVHKYL